MIERTWYDLYQFEYIYFQNRNNKLMTSNSIFGCCNAFSSVEDSQGPYSSLFRNNRFKTKKLCTLNSPKASLKAISHQRGHKNMESMVHSSQIHMTSTTDVTDNVHRNVPTGYKPVSPHIINSIPYIWDKTNKQVFLTSLINKQVIRVPSMPKEKVHFSYNDSRNLENLLNQPEAAPMGQVKNNKIQIKKLLPSPIKHPMLQSKLNLGGSKFTVLSEGEIQENPKEQKDMKMEQSEIIVNVFHPTNSQIEKWTVHPTIKEVNK